MHATPQPTWVFVRGDPGERGEQVKANAPSFLHAFSPATPDQPTRIDLANWLVSPDNPLLARVTVNRMWQRLFGVGLVETANDFGMQTPKPLFADLLDYLASEFGRDWSIKRLLRLILTSRTYQQSSAAPKELRQIDPNNRLFARQRRLRLEAEVVRDVTLHAGGLLSQKMNGPSVFPWQPEGVLNNRATPAKWVVSDGQDRYRRGLYTWVWRLTPHPHLPLFDAPDGASACTRRDRSNVPVQALTLLNDPTFVECSRALARRVLSNERTDDRRFAFLFATCLSRVPQPRELDILRRLIDEQRRQLSADVTAAQQIVGESGIAESELADLAAWSVVCRVILNLDEFITRE
jgi:hypothetical protein